MPSAREPARKSPATRRRATPATIAVPIKGKVATVIPPYDVAINVGRSGGVQEDDIAVVCFVVNIDDPDTARRLGAVQYVRGRFRVTVLADAYCVATMADYLPSASANTVNFSTAMLMPPPLKRVVDRGSPRPDDGLTGTGLVAIAVGDPVYFERPPASEGT